MSRFALAFSANDRYYDWTLPFLQSIREHNADLKLYLIPYDDHVDKTLALRRHFDFEPIDADLAAIDGFSERLFPAHRRERGNMRRFAALQIDCDEVAYFDVDMVLCADPARLFGYVSASVCDLIYLSTSEEWVYRRNKLALARAHFPNTRLFSAGAFVTSPRILTVEKIIATIEENWDLYVALRMPRMADQTILNFVVDRLDLACRHIGECDERSAGMVSHRYRDIRFEGEQLVQSSTGRDVTAVHWAGVLKRGVGLINPRIRQLRRYHAAMRKRVALRLAGH
ncbi:MAG TPA: hypothetical protein VET85_06715 [Stellaceae bacterium]|nr:hypothetical protein [Stellaceae bacterium]